MLYVGGGTLEIVDESKAGDIIKFWRHISNSVRERETSCLIVIHTMKEDVGDVGIQEMN